MKPNRLVKIPVCACDEKSSHNLVRRYARICEICEFTYQTKLMILLSNEGEETFTANEGSFKWFLVYFNAANIFSYIICSNTKKLFYSFNIFQNLVDFVPHLFQNYKR